MSQSGPGTSHAGGGKTAQQGKSGEGDLEAEFRPPLKPRPRLLWALLIVFVLWVAGLLAMYFKTVYPYRHDPTRNAQEVDR